MNIDEFNKYFELELIKNNISIERDCYSGFFDYMKKIIEWNSKINLTAITDEKEFVVKHFIDSLTIMNYIKNKDRVLDIGTGAGFPGMPLKLANSELDIALVDAVNKKLNVIRDITEQMQLKNIKIIHSRAEDLGKNLEYRERFDLVTTRAVSNLSTIAEYMLPLVNIGKIAICMKGPNIKEELNESKKAIDILGGKIEEIKNIIIDNEIERNLVIIRKFKKTPNIYPRSNGKPLKEPIR